MLGQGLSTGSASKPPALVMFDCVTFRLYRLFEDDDSEGCDCHRSQSLNCQRTPIHSFEAVVSFLRPKVGWFSQKRDM
jgi:hypothetical protein